MKKAVEGKTLVFKFDGDLAPIVFDPTRVAGDNRVRAEMAGWSQRLGDNAAITKGPENGYKVTEAMRREAVMELVDHYYGESTEWSPKAKAKGPSYNPHIQAIAEKKGCSYDEAAVWFQAKLMAELTAD